MKNYNRELLVLYKEELIDESLLQHEVDNLNQILVHTEKFETFCKAHELINRNRITRKASAISKAVQDIPLKPFQFLINRN